MLKFNFQDTLKESKQMAKVSDWIAPTLTKQSIAEMDTNVGLDLSGTKLGSVLSGRKATTLMISRVPSIEWRSDWRPFISINEVPWNRMTRILGFDREERFATRTIVREDGTSINARIRIPYLNLKGLPIVYVNFVDSNESNSEQQGAHLLSKELINEGFKINGNQYEYAMSSGSQKRELAGVFIRTDYEVPKSILDCLNNLDYAGFVSGLRGARALLEVLTYGAYSYQFSSEFADYLRKNVDLSVSDLEIATRYPGIMLKPVEISLAKFMARVGMSLTSSTPFGKDWSVLHMGSVRFKVERMMPVFAAMTFIDDEGRVVKRYSKEELQDIEKFWKEEKLDGQNLIRASKVINTYKQLYNKTVSAKDICGELMQFRWAGVKGTGLVVADKYLDDCRTPDGEYIYRGHDLIVEDASWKYSPTTFYQGEMAPEFELVSISKKRYSSYLNYQFINALDGAVGKDTVSETVMALVDETIESVRKAMYSQSDFLAKFGITDRRDDFLQGLGIDTHEMTIKSKSGQIVDTLDEAVHDPYIRRKLLENFRKGADEVAIGKIEVEGANRYVISDPTAMLRTDLAKKGSDGLWHITLTDTNQVAMRGPEQVFWNSKTGECVIFRSPCVHPGEPQRMMLVDMLAIPKTLSTGYGDIDIETLFNSIRNVIVLNGWCNALESLGGADTDGDTVLCSTDPRVVAQRNFYRPTVFAAVDDKTITKVLSTASIKQDMITSLKDNSIGLITNYATTWRDIQLYALWCRRNDAQLPRNVEQALAKVGKAADANLKLNNAWVDEDKSLKDLALLGREEEDYGRYLVNVSLAASAALAKLRELQEIAINTAKSGVFVTFNSEDKEENNLKHLSIGVRADWHKPNYKKEMRYKSFSPMGIANRHAKEAWKKLAEESTDTARSMFPDADTYFDAELLEVVEEVQKIKAHYGKAVNVLTLDKQNRKISEDEFSIKFGELTEDMHTELMILSMAFGLDVVALIAYDITYKSARKNGEGASFVWNCFFEEFLHTVKLNRAFGDEKPLNQRLYPVNLSPDALYMSIPSGVVSISSESVVLSGFALGTCRVPDGEYEMVSVDSRCYVKQLVAMKDPLELKAFFDTRDIMIRLVGFKYYEDMVAGGFLTKEKIEQYLTSDMGQNIIRVKTVNLDNFSKISKVNFYIRYAVDADGAAQWMPIGTLEQEYKWVSRALNNKIIRVAVKRTTKEYDSMLNLAYEETLVDELQ